MQGTVRNYDSAKGYGRIKVDGENREVFAHKAECKSGQMNNDARVSFDIDETAAKGPRAINIAVINSGTAVPQPKPEPKGLSVSWHFGEAMVQTFQSAPPAPPEDLLTLPLTLAIKRGNQPRAAVITSLTVDGNVQYGNVTTDGTLGQADFEIVLPKDATRSFLKAVVKDGDQEILSQRLWTKTKQESATLLDKSCKVISVVRLTTSDGFTAFRILSLTGGNEGVDEEVLVESTEELELKWNGKLHIGSIATDHGHALVEVRTKDSKKAASVYFRSLGNPLVASDPQVLEAWEPKKVEPKAWTLQRLRIPGEIYIFIVEGPANSEISLESTVRLQTRKHPCDVRAGWTTELQYETNERGGLQLQVKVENPGERGDLFLCSRGFRSTPWYVGNFQRHSKSRR